MYLFIKLSKIHFSFSRLMKRYENQNLQFKSQLKVIAIITLDINLKKINKKRRTHQCSSLFYMKLGFP
ncbi:hypothetical protein BAU28_02815 [Bacillus paramycoides]|uniref:Uncharacterized protein n=1 Tax=Bacillus paramycoides TaxID=2026194 RepID=A0A1J9VQ00_9BACI|nr:hypothetical protein BAU28_02815 [Bacillus paramycoides]